MGDHDLTTVGALIIRLRKMRGHVGARDKETLGQAVDAIFELAQRLEDATKAAKPNVTLTHERRPRLDHLEGLDVSKVSL